MRTALKGWLYKRNPSRHPLRQKGKKKKKQEPLEKDLRKGKGGKAMLLSFDTLYALSDVTDG